MKVFFRFGVPSGDADHDCDASCGSEQADEEQAVGGRIQRHEPVGRRSDTDGEDDQANGEAAATSGGRIVFHIRIMRGSCQRSGRTSERFLSGSAGPFLG